MDRACTRCGGDVYGTGSYQLCDQCLDVVLFGDKKKSDHQLFSPFSANSEVEIRENTRDLRGAFSQDIREFTRLETIFKVLNAWSKQDFIALGAKPMTRAVASPRLPSAFISYVGREASERAWRIRHYLAERGVDGYTYTLPDSVPPERMQMEKTSEPLASMDETLDGLARLISGYAAMVLVLSRSVHNDRGRGSYYVTSEILAATSNHKHLFALPLSDVGDDTCYRFDKRVTFVPSIDDLGLFFEGRR